MSLNIWCNFRERSKDTGLKPLNLFLLQEHQMFAFFESFSFKVNESFNFKLKKTIKVEHSVVC